MSGGGQGKTQHNVGIAACYSVFMHAAELGQALKAARKARRLTMKEVAAACGRTYQWVDHIEAGRREASFKDLDAFAQVVGMRLVVELVPGHASEALYLEPEVSEIATQLSELSTARLNILRRILPALRVGPEAAIEAAASLLEIAQQAQALGSGKNTEGASLSVQHLIAGEVTR